MVDVPALSHWLEPWIASCAVRVGLMCQSFEHWLERSRVTHNAAKRLIFQCLVHWLELAHCPASLRCMEVDVTVLLALVGISRQAKFKSISSMY